MPNTERWTKWIVMLKESDSIIVSLATMAALAVLVWEMLRRVPEPWRDRLRSVCLLAMLIIYIYLMGGAFDKTQFTVALFVVMFAIGGRLAIGFARRPRPTQEVHDGNSSEEH